jgi:formylglycine-generating enzyme required for sulfatase activity
VTFPSHNRYGYVADNPLSSRSPKGDGRGGQSDLAGNLGEWMLDASLFVYPMPCDNCAALTRNNSGESVRSGNFRFTALGVRSGWRAKNGPSDRVRDIGARCARTRP